MNEIVLSLDLLRHLYLILFSVFYGVMLTLCRGLHAFDTSAAFAGDRRALARVLLSISLLNAVPFFYFALTFINLIIPLSVEIFSIFVVLALSLSVFGFYKILYSVLVAMKERLYYAQNETNLKGYYPYDADRKIVTEFDRHYMQHLVPGILYVFVPLCLTLVYYNVALGIVSLAALFGSTVALSYVVRIEERGKALT